jgi:hypothetical protein
MNRASADRWATRARPLRLAGAFAPLLAALVLVTQPGPAHAAKLSDQNRDGVVDLADLILFSQDELGQDWQTIDWCLWLESPYKKDKHLRDLVDFIDTYFACGEADPLRRDWSGGPTRNASTSPMPRSARSSSTTPRSR